MMNVYADVTHACTRTCSDEASTVGGITDMAKGQDKPCKNVGLEVSFITVVKGSGIHTTAVNVESAILTVG